MKGLRFQPAQPAIIFKANNKGGHTREQDRSEWTTLHLRRSDLNECMEALKWACLDSVDFFFNPPDDRAEIIHVEIPGRFSPELSTNDISELVRDWQILQGHYPNYADVFKSISGKLAETLFCYLIDKAEGKPVELEPWAKRVLELKREDK